MFGSLALVVKARRELEATEAAWLRDVAEYDRSGDWSAEGFQNAAAAIRQACNMDASVAHSYVRFARRLTRLPKVFEAFANGEISSRHAAVIANAYSPERAVELGNVESELVEAARNCTPKDLVGIVRYVTDAIDGDGGATADEREHDGRSCYVANMLNGSFDLRANSDKLSGAVVTAALDAAMAQDLQRRDTRTTPQRRFDALLLLSRSYLERGDAGESHGIRPHVVAVIDVEELRNASGDTGVRVPSQSRRNSYSSTMLGLILCDCDLSRVVMAGDSEVLDVGRATRNVSAAQWKALVARDKHCTHSGCTRPPEQCEAHHIRFWHLGGPTDLDNLRLLCWHHHRQLHVNDAEAKARGG